VRRFAGRLRSVFDRYALGAFGLLYFVGSLAFCGLLIWKPDYVGHHVFAVAKPLYDLFLAWLPVFAILAVFRRTRFVAGMYGAIAAWVFGATGWAWALLVTYDYWGRAGVVIGTLIMGIGIVPISVVAGGLHGDWFSVSRVLLCVGLAFGCRYGSLWLSHHDGQRKPTASQDVESPPMSVAN